DVTRCAAPSQPAGRIRRDVVEVDAGVAVGVELGGQVGMGDPEAGGIPTGAAGTAGAPGAVGDGRLPHVTRRAAPPQRAVRPRRDLVEVDVGVAVRIEFGGDVGVGDGDPAGIGEDA